MGCCVGLGTRVWSLCQAKAPGSCSHGAAATYVSMVVMAESQEWRYAIDTSPGVMYSSKRTVFKTLLNLSCLGQRDGRGGELCGFLLCDNTAL